MELLLAEAYKDHATLGSGAIVGAGSGVTCDVPAGKTVWVILLLKRVMP
jgi:hypothetical protein